MEQFPLVSEAQNEISATGSYTKYTTSVLFNINLIYIDVLIFSFLNLNLEAF